MQLESDNFFLTSSVDIREICKPLEKLRIKYFTYTRSYTNGTRIYLTTVPDWIQSYFKHNFYLIGNCEYKPLYYKDQILLWSTLPKQNIYQQVREMGFKEGIFIINPEDKFTEFFEFASDDPRVNIVNVYLTHIEFLKLFMAYFKEKAAPIIRNAKKNNFILPHKTEKISFLDDIQVDFNELFNNKLTKQQYACAIRLLEGKSYKEIAIELKLSPRTVETYITNLKSKFNSHNKTDLVLKLANILNI